MNKLLLWDTVSSCALSILIVCRPM